METDWDDTYDRHDTPETARSRLVDPPGATARGHDIRPPERPVRRRNIAPPPGHRQSPPTGPRPRPRQPVGYSEPKRTGTSSIPALIGLVLVLAALLVGFVVVRSIEGDDVAQVDSPSTSAAVEGEGQPGGTDAGTDTSAVPVAVPDVAAAPVAPYVQATLTGPELVLTGTVPSAELAAGLQQAAEMVYAPFVRSELMVDEQLPAPEWLATTPQAIMLLQLINGGTMTISEGQISVSGQAASNEELAELEQFLAEGTGLPLIIGQMEITNLRPTIYIIASTDGQLALSGALPSEEIRAGLTAAAVAVYGEERVFDASTVDETVDTALWMYSPEALLAVLSAFPEFEVRLNGGAFSASLSGGSTFPAGSTEFTPAFAQVLNFGIVVLARDPAMTMRIEGHTDSQGTDDSNLVLSQARAEAVAAYMMGGGIGSERLTAVGMGESSPVAPNDTPEGRARNRRIEFDLVTAP